ncbi:MAG: hypothetical protein PHO41_01870 [Eubacteriales bacterium]|nr:hypothetical protein [Eubacteriales bacterium]
MEYYPYYNEQPEKEGILSGFGLSPDSPFITSSAAFHDRQSAPANSMIAQRVTSHRGEMQRAAAQQAATTALLTGLGRV